MVLIELKEVTKRFGSNTVLDKIDMSVAEDEILGIIGVNGSGKTTILRLIVGFYKQDHGSIMYDGKKVSRSMQKVKKELGFATQENSFYPRLTVEENIKYFASMYGMSGKSVEDNLNKVLHLVELDHVRDKIAEKLSGGMQRRLDMACSLIHVPRVLILDEPTEDLDPLLRKDILRLIKKIKKIGTTVIMTSHLLEDVEHTCDRVAILHNKKIVKECTIDELRSFYSPHEEIHIQTVNEKYETIIKNISQYDEYYIEEGKLMIKTRDAEKTLHEVLHIIENTDEKLLYADLQRPPLAEIFLQMTRGKEEKNFLERN